MISIRDNKGHLKVCLTLIFKVNYGGQVTYISHIEIPNIGYVQIDTSIVSLSSIQPMMNKGSHKVSLTLIFKVILWGQVTNFNNCEIRGTEHKEIDNDIKLLVFEYYMLIWFSRLTRSNRKQSSELVWTPKFVIYTLVQRSWSWPEIVLT